MAPITILGMKGRPIWPASKTEHHDVECPEVKEKRSLDSTGDESRSFFLSHAGSDCRAARLIAAEMEAAGLPTWCDVSPKALDLGLPWRQQLEDRIEASSGMLVLVGNQEIAGWALVELDIALDRNTKAASYAIVPVLLPGVALGFLPPSLRRFQAFQLYDGWLQPRSDDLSALAERLLVCWTPTAATLTGLGPFPGLEAFDEELAGFFFGREAEVRELVHLLGRTPAGHRRWLQIEGASGSGKSSLARAGLVPAVRRGWLEDAPENWQVVVFRPGKNPLRSLAQQLVNCAVAAGLELSLRATEKRLADDGATLLYMARELVAEGQGFLLLLDQLEEVFTLAGTEPMVVEKLDGLLARALDDTDGPFYLITTVRSDFLHQLDHLPQLRAHLNLAASRYFLAAIGEKGLLRAVEEPARIAGLRWESPELPRRIVADSGASASGLPLVAHALRALWEQDHLKPCLSHVTYDRLGGVAGALSKSAEGLLSALGEEGRALSRKLFLSLVKVGRATPDSSRILSRKEVLAASGGDEQAEKTLARLSGGRDPAAPEAAPSPARLIVVSGEERVELVHEALLRSWATLRRWVGESRQALERRDDVEDAARAWKAAGSPEGGLPQEGQLAYFCQTEGVSELAGQFLAQAIALDQRKQTDRKSTRRWAMAGIGLPFLSLGALLLALTVLTLSQYDAIISSLIASLFLENAENELNSSPEKALKAFRVGEGIAQELLPTSANSDNHRLLLARIALGQGEAFSRLDQTKEATEAFQSARNFARNSSEGATARDRLLLRTDLAEGRLCLAKSDKRCLETVTASTKTLIPRIVARPVLMREVMSFQIEANQFPGALETAKKIEKTFPMLGEAVQAQPLLLLDLLLRLGFRARRFGYLNSARTAFERALALELTIAAQEPSNPDHWSTIENLESDLATTLIEQGDLPAARRTLETALSSPAKEKYTKGPRQQGERLHMRFCFLAQLGEVCSLQNDLEAAEKVFSRAAALSQSLLPSDFDSEWSTGQQADIQLRLSVVEEGLGKRQESMKRSELALGLFRSLVEKDPRNLGLQQDYLHAQQQIREMLWHDNGILPNRSSVAIREVNIAFPLEGVLRHNVCLGRLVGPSPW